MNTKGNQLHSALIGGYSAHKKRTMAEFQKLNLTAGQPKILSILSNKEGYLQKDLAAAAHVRPPTMSSLLSNMVAKDLVYKKEESVSGGKRAYSIYLTDKGHNMAEKVNKIVDDVEIISFKGFDDSEKQQLIDLLNRVQSNLEKNF